MSKKILILGASGLLGQTLVKLCNSQGLLIGVASRTLMQYSNKNIIEYSLDILDYVHLESIVSKYDIVINCTGQISYPINNCLQLNTIGIKNIINAVKKNNCKLIQLSSVSVYGSSKFIDENSELNPETTYGTMKSFADFLIQEELKNYVILRVSNLYGNNQKKGIINYLTQSYINNKQELVFNNNGELSRYYLNVDDLSSLIYQLLAKNIDGIFNVTSDKQYTIKELIEMFEKNLNYKYSVNYSSNLPCDNVQYISNEKIKNIIDFNNTSLENYIRSLI